MTYYHADVFTPEPLSGNGLTIFLLDKALSPKRMQRTALELKQFETIFLQRVGKTRFRARIFTLEEELDFAGHPVLGAAAAMHETFFSTLERVALSVELNQKTVEVRSAKNNQCFIETMNQGSPSFLNTVEGKRAEDLLQAVGLSPRQRHPALPMEVVSTGLPYLLLPIKGGLELARPAADRLPRLLQAVGAKFAYVFDPTVPEGRTWDGAGREDVATGSAAGPVGAYLRKWGLCLQTDSVVLRQGRFLNRPSQIKVSFTPSGDIQVAGDVRLLLKGEALC